MPRLDPYVIVATRAEIDAQRPPKTRVSYRVLSPLWRDGMAGDEPRYRGWATMRLPLRWRVVAEVSAWHIPAESHEGISAHWTKRSAQRMASELRLALMAAQERRCDYSGP